MALRARSCTGSDVVSRVANGSAKATNIQLMRGMNTQARLRLRVFPGRLATSALNKDP